MASESRADGPRLRRRAALGGLALAAVPLAGCAWNPLNKPATDQSLRVWLSAYRSLDPIQTQSAQEAEYVVQVFSGLTGLNDKLEVVPDLAEKWQVSTDGRTYTFALRKAARFHDGRDVKAADVKYSLERAAEPANKSPGAATYLNDIAGVAARLQGQASEIGGVKGRADVTVEITIAEP